MDHMEVSYSGPKTLLAVLAHPDDESYGMGGTLALYARRGVKVHYSGSPLTVKATVRQ